MLQRAETPATLAGVDAARASFAAFVDPVAGPETLWVAHLDEDACCLAVKAYPGSGDTGIAPTRAILADAARFGSAGLVLAHRQARSGGKSDYFDCVADRRLALCAEACNVTLVDHLVFAGDQCTSMRRIGLL
jgi:DNA repair protein RadC